MSIFIRPNPALVSDIMFVTQNNIKAAAPESDPKRVKTEMVSPIKDYKDRLSAWHKINNEDPMIRANPLPGASRSLMSNFGLGLPVVLATADIPRTTVQEAIGLIPDAIKTIPPGALLLSVPLIIAGGLAFLVALNRSSQKNKVEPATGASVGHGSIPIEDAPYKGRLLLGAFPDVALSPNDIPTAEVPKVPKGKRIS
ncbi:MAG: hypothetical protein H7A33_08285 [Deltaproteobacteria bacterium]|nr:hypothetical protein [Deltaproteobacteria bacterium]